MNEVTRVDTRFYQGANVLAPSSSAGVKESGGKVLPPQVPSVAAQSDIVNKSVDTKPEVPSDIEQRLQAAVAQMNEYIQSTQRDLHFSYDEGSGETVVKVLDRSTQDIIRQIPNETFLKLAQRIDSEGTLHLLRAQA